MATVEQYAIIESTQYQKCRSKLDRNDSILNELDQKINQLRKNPRPPLTKALGGNLFGSHTVRFGKGDTHRLIVVINHNARIVRLNYLAPRIHVYTGLMW